MNDIMKTVKYLEDFGLFIKGIRKRITNNIFNMLLGALGVSLLGNKI